MYEEWVKESYEAEYGPLAPCRPDELIEEAEEEFPWLDT